MSYRLDVKFWQYVKFKSSEAFIGYLNEIYVCVHIANRHEFKYRFVCILFFIFSNMVLDNHSYF